MAEIRVSRVRSRLRFEDLDGMVGEGVLVSTGQRAKELSVLEGYWTREVIGERHLSQVVV